MRREAVVLLVEDNAWDAEVTIEALLASRVAKRVKHVRDGEEVFRFLRGAPPFEGEAKPDLVILDLNLPRKDGREVLAEMKGDADLRRIPVLVLTTSMAERDIVDAYDLHANAYLRKPDDTEEYAGIVRAIDEFWLQLSVPPTR